MIIFRWSSVSAITTTDVTVVLAEKPAADLATSDFSIKVNGTAVAAPTAVTKVASDLTGKTYKLTIASLANTEGSLTVNGVEKAFDFKAPEVVSVVAKGTKTIEVTFNEAIKDTTVLASNFTITKAVGTIDTTTIKPVLNADGTKVTLTWTGSGELTVADYVLKLGDTATETATNRVKDVAGNSIYGGTEISFRPTADQLAVKEAPSVTTVSYNNGTGIATVTFNKDITYTNVDITKITFGGVALTTSDVVAQGATNSVTITLSADTKEAVNAVTGALSFVGAEGAWTDGTTATTGQTVTVTKVTPAVISSASYSQETKVLTINFDQPVTINSLAGIHVDDATAGSDAVASGAKNPDGTDLDTTTASVTWNLKLDDAQVINLEDLANDKTKLKVYLDTDAVRNDSTTVISNVATTYADGGVVVTYTSDSTKPYVTGVEYDNRTNKLTITFNESLDDVTATNAKSVGAVNIATTATGDTNAFDLSALDTTTVELDTTKKVLTIAFSGADVAASAETGKLDNQYFTAKPIKVWFTKDVLVDKNGLKNDATTFDTGIVLTYHDFLAPQLDTTNTNTLNQTYVKVKFNEAVDKTTAQTAANYVIKDLSGNTLAVNSAVLQSDNKTVYLNTSAQESGKPYTLVVSNVRDLQQNLIDTTTNSKTFYGSSATATGKLGVNSTLVVTAPVNSKNDTLAVTFDAAVNQTQAVDLSNYSVLEATADTPNGWDAATAVPLTDATAKVDTLGTTVTITLGSYNLQAGKFYKVVVGNVTDAYGNTLDSTKTTAKSVVLDAENLTVPSITETNTKAGAVILTFDQELNATEAVKVANYKVGLDTPAKATYAWDATKAKATVTLDVTTALTAPTNVQIKDAVTNLAGETINGATYTSNYTTITAPATLGDTVAPKVSSVVAKAGPDVQDDTIKVNFDSNDVLQASAKLAANYVVKDTQGNVIPSTDYDITFNDNDVNNSNNDSVTIEFNKAIASGYEYNLQAGQSYSVSVSNVVDTSGNKVEATTTTSSWDTSTDITAPTINGTAATVDAGAKTITITYDNAVDTISATNTANYAIVYDEDGDFTTTIDETVINPIFVALSGNNATITVANIVTSPAAGSKYKVTVTGVKDLAGNVQTEGSSAESSGVTTGVTGLLGSVTEGRADIPAVKATQTLTVNAIPTDDETLDIGDKVIGFKAGGGSVAGADFVIDTTSNDTSEKVADAIEDLSLGGNVLISSTAVSGNSTVELEAAVAGVAGNSLTTNDGTGGDITGVGNLANGVDLIAGNDETADLTVTHGANATGNITVTVNGADHTVDVTAGQTVEQVATAIYNQLTTDGVTGYAVTNSSSGVVTFTSTTAKTDVNPNITVTIH